MTGYRSSKLRYTCETKGCFISQLPSWDWFLDVFPRGVIPTDVDAMVELNGWFLFIEQKGARVPLPEGQRLALQRLSAKSPKIVVIVIREVAGEPDQMDRLLFVHGEANGWERISKRDLRLWFAAWSTVDNLAGT